MHRITVLPGDGIGKEVIEAILPIFKILNLPIKYDIEDIGWTMWELYGTPIPDRTWNKIKSSDASLLGAITSKPKDDAIAALPKHLKYKNLSYTSPLITIRKDLDLFANIRPCFSTDPSKRFSFTIIRENTEGLYAGFDFSTAPKEILELIGKDKHWAYKIKENISCSLRLQSESSLMRIFEFAFKYAETKSISRVTLADKPNVLRNSSCQTKNIFEYVAKNYPCINHDIMNVDAVGMQIVRKPESFGVIVTENMFGDILSDVAAGVMGGLGLAPSANVGINNAYFEPVHGSGLKMEYGSANPAAMFFSLAMLLEYLGYVENSAMINKAVMDQIYSQNSLTKDLGGNASTFEMSNAILNRISN